MRAAHPLLVARRRPARRRLVPASPTRTVVLALGAVLLLAGSSPPALAQRSDAVASVAAVGMTVSDLDAAVAFYTGVLDFAVVERVELVGAAVEHLTGVFGARVEVARLRLGDETLELTEFLAPEGRPFPADTRSNDRWFQHVAIVTSDMARAYAHLREHDVRHASSGPQRLPDWNPNAGGIEAFYFRDPDGHFLEIIAFPPEKGDPRWHARAGDGLFLGIDHTAIVVADAERSLGCYRDALGLEVAGESENYGPEQEHLNNVFGARLRIVGLRAGDGPGVELLEYLAPGDGRPTPADTRANDLWHWTIRLATPDAARLGASAREACGDWVSPGAVDVAPLGLPFAVGLRTRDPDGHVLELVAAGQE